MTFRTVKHCAGCPKLIRTVSVRFCWSCREHRKSLARYCDCGGVIGKASETQCVRCRRPAKVSTPSEASRHISTSVYLRFDPIVAKYAWSAAVSR